MTMRFLVRFIACAIKTPVRAARAAILGESISEMLSRPVQPHGEIVPRHPELFGDIAEIVPLQIHFLQKLAVLLRHQRHQSPETLAESPLIFFVRRLRYFFFEPFQRAAAHALLSVNIDNRPPEDAIEPRRGLFVGVWLPIGRQRFNDAFLNDVFRQMLISHPASRERDEYLEVLENCIFNAWHAPKVSPTDNRCNQTFTLV